MIRLSGGLRSSLIIGGQGIRARKLRTLLSMLSLFLGVLAVVVVQASAETAQRALLSNLELTAGVDGTTLMYLPSSPQTRPIILDTVAARPDTIAVTSTQAIIGEPRVTPINSGGVPFDQPGGGFPATMMVCDQNGCRQYGGDQGSPAPPGQAIELRLTALTGDIRQFRPFRPESGEWLDFSSAPSFSPRLVLNKEAAKGFTRYLVPAEMRINGAIANATPRIIGVVDDGAPEPAAYVRADELMNWVPDLGNPGPYGGGWQVMFGPAAVDFEQTLRTRLTATGVRSEEISWEVINARKNIENQLALMRWLFLGMAAVVLLVGVAGILNVGLATVGERIEEFALRRAVGTPRTLLAAIVLAETLLTGLLTAAAAIGVGALGLDFISPYLGAREPALQNMEFPWQAALAGVIAGLGAGLLGGLIPATRAARIPIATVMRA